MLKISTKRKGKDWSVWCSDCGEVVSFPNPDRGMIEIWCRDLIAKHEQDHNKGRI